MGLSNKSAKRLRLELIDYRNALRQRLLKKHNDNESYKGLKDLIETYLELAERNALKDPIIGDIKKQEILNALSNYTIDLSFISLNYCNEKERARELFNISRTTSAFILHVFTDTNVDIKALIENYREIEKNLLRAFGNYDNGQANNLIFYPYQCNTLYFVPDNDRVKIQDTLILDYQFGTIKDSVNFCFNSFFENNERILEIKFWEDPIARFTKIAEQKGEYKIIYNPCTLIDLLNIAYANGYDYLKLRLELFNEFPLNGYIDKTIKQALDVLSKICFVKQCIDINIDKNDGKGYYILKPLALYDVEERLFYLNQHLAYDESGNLIFKRREKNEIFIYQPFINRRAKAIMKNVYKIYFRLNDHNNIFSFFDGPNEKIKLDEKPSMFLNQFYIPKSDLYEILIKIFGFYNSIENSSLVVGADLSNVFQISRSKKDKIYLPSCFSALKKVWIKGERNIKARAHEETYKLLCMRYGQVFARTFVKEMFIRYKKIFDTLKESQISRSYFFENTSVDNLRDIVGTFIGLAELLNLDERIVYKSISKFFIKLKNIGREKECIYRILPFKFIEYKINGFFNSLAWLSLEMVEYKEEYLPLVLDLLYEPQIYYYISNLVKKGFRGFHQNPFEVSMLKYKNVIQGIFNEDQNIKNKSLKIMIKILEKIKDKIKDKKRLNRYREFAGDRIFDLLNPIYDKEVCKKLMKDEKARKLLNEITGICMKNKILYEQIKIRAFCEFIRDINKEAGL